MPQRTSLTLGQQIFIGEYKQSLNLTQSVLKGFPKMSYGTARAYGVFLKKKHPIVSKLLHEFHQQLLGAVSGPDIVGKYLDLYNANYNKKAWLTTRKSNGQLIKREILCTPLALRALSGMADVLKKLHF